MSLFTFRIARVGYILVLVLTMQSCSHSLVYSPALNLPSKPLRQNETDIHAALELFPETRPSANNSFTTLGFTSSLGYGFTDKFNMYGRLWITAKSGMIRSGISINGQIIKRIDEDQYLTILPRIGVVMDNNTLQGYGVSVSSIYTSKFTKKTSIYGGAGLLWGIHYLGSAVNPRGESKIPMGFGLLFNTGIVWDISPSLRLNMEINPVYQINTFENNQKFVISSTLGFGYTFHK